MRSPYAAEFRHAHVGEDYVWAPLTSSRDHATKLHMWTHEWRSKGNESKLRIIPLAKAKHASEIDYDTVSATELDHDTKGIYPMATHYQENSAIMMFQKIDIYF